MVRGAGLKMAKNGLEAIKNRLDAIKNRLEAIKNRLEAIKNRLEAIKNRLEAIKNRLGGVADFSYWQCYEGRAIGSPDGPIAQLDRVTDFYSVGCRFESCWDRQRFQCDKRSVLVKCVSHLVWKKTL
jgi:hypothetical protein